MVPAETERADRLLFPFPETVIVAVIVKIEVVAVRVARVVVDERKLLQSPRAAVIADAPLLVPVTARKQLSSAQAPSLWAEARILGIRPRRITTNKGMRILPIGD